MSEPTARQARQVLERAETLLAAGTPRDVAAAAKLAKAALDKAAEAGLREEHTRALAVLGRAFVERREYARAKPFHTAALERFRQVGDMRGAAASLGGLGLCKLGIGNTADAVPLLRQAITLLHDEQAWQAESAWRVHLDHTLRLLDRAQMRITELWAWVPVAEALGDDALRHSLLSDLVSSCEDVGDQPGADAARAAL